MFDASSDFALDPWLIGLALIGMIALRWPFGLRPGQRLRRVGALLAAGVVLLAVGAVAYRWSLVAGLAELRQRGQHRLELYSESMEREVTKFGYVPSILGLEQNVLALLARQERPDAALTGRVNVFLEQLNKRAGTTAIYVMDRRGRVVAASNWSQPESFLGQDFSYRPYVIDGLQGRPGRFYGIGTTSGAPGYYLSYGISGPDGIRGVAAAKISLEGLEQTWSTSEAPVLVTDENGVVILSSIPAWKFAATRPISPERLAELERTRRYNGRPLPPLGIVTLDSAPDGSQRVRLPSSRKQELAPGEGGVFLVQKKPIEGSGWQLTVFTSTAQVRELALTHGALAALATAFILVLLTVARERRRHIRERLAAREALQQAHDELEKKVEQRTGELSDTVAQLQAEVAERVRAENTLRKAQEGLVQAGKLAVIGQLSAGITHELNQPLAALRTLSGNTLKYLDRGRLDTVRSNLQTMDQMAERMGHITGQLKRFARKSTGQQQAVDVGNAFANALSLLAQRIRKEQVQVSLELTESPLLARGDQNRLEQVLVNLVGNALDAMGDNEAAGRPRELRLCAHREAALVVLRVMDNGSGLPVQVLERLFEPFLTTKEPGVGLGLGLPISAGIVRDCGGELNGANRPECGAVFTVRLPAVKELEDV